MNATPATPATPATAATIVVVEDEVMIATSVAKRLQAEGHRVEVSYDGLAGVALCERVRPDLVVLDVMLPGIDGHEVCRRIQRERPVPVLMLTARDDETDVLVGLGVGADDYLTKPFSMRELAARVAALLRRVERAAALHGSVSPTIPPPLVVGDLVVDPARRQVVLADRAVELTATEFDLLHRLAERPGLVRTREQLLADVWGYRDGAATRTVDSHVASLRRKLGADRIRTAHGVGYALAEPS
ncbi:response regulator transcription factor [Egicoccus halophilus]|uniref:DNA-binding response regulator n=1 Tax=Egicoccus halophilus TaxID=1670830 RepID=A0A8J3EV09_9ACTN|nr:response regulator transcription factor [Egicoccus halophilus]GGI07115.1 DNA-binding response regulator [Egicoccus halophilus]